MNNSKIWLVVKPTVGVPLFLTAVAVGSFAVHVAVLSNTTWVSDFLSGNELGSGAQSAALAPFQSDTDPAKVAHLSSEQTFGAGQEVLVTLPNGTTATAILQAPTVLAQAASSKIVE